MKTATFVLTVCADDPVKLAAIEDAIVEAAGESFITLPEPDIEDDQGYAPRARPALVLVHRIGEA